MAALVSLVVCLPSLASQPERAVIMHYSPGLFEKVAQVRIRQGYRLPKTEGYAAVPQCSRIGSIIRVSVNGKTARVTVADCARPRDYKRLLAMNAVELDYATARRLGIVKAGRMRGWVWAE